MKCGRLHKSIFLVMKENFDLAFKKFTSLTVIIKMQEKNLKFNGFKHIRTVTF